MSDVQTTTSVELAPVAIATGELAAMNDFSSEQQVQIQERIKSAPALKDMDETQVVLWGSSREKEVSKKLDALLGQVSEQDSPIVFQVMRRLKKGVKEANIKEIEAEIKAGLEEGWFKVPEWLGGKSAEDKIEAMHEKFRTLLAGKTKTLRDLTSAMEDELMKGIRELIEGNVVMDQQIGEYQISVVAYGMDVAAGRVILEQALKDEAELIAAARASRDPLKAQAARDFQRKIARFHNRLLVLMTLYADAPVMLEQLSGMKAASLETLSETASSSMSEFNKIKGLLLALVGLYKIQSVQAMNAERRRIKAQLQSLTTQLYESVVTQSARAAGDNRLEDAQLVLTVATALENVGDKVAQIHTENKQKFAKAEALLLEAKEKIRQIGIKETGRIIGQEQGDPLAKY